MPENPKQRVDLEFHSKLTGAGKLKGDVAGLAGALAEPGAVLAAGGTSSQAAWAGMRAVLIDKVLGPLGLITGAMFGIAAVMRIVIRNTQLMANGLKAVRDIEMMETQFRPLLGGLEQARQRVAELFQFSASTPFQLKGISEASRLLQLFTNGLLAVGPKLRMVGDSAAVAGRPIEETAFWIGRLYAAMKGGAPIGEAVMRLTEMGLITPSLRSELEQISEAGGSFTMMWGAVEKQLEKNKGGMEDLSKTMVGLESTLADVRSMAAATFARPFLEGEKGGIKASIATYRAMTPVLEEIASVTNALIAPFRAAKQWMKLSAAESGVLTSTLKRLFQAFIVLATAVTAVQFKVLAVAVAKMATSFRAAKVATLELAAAEKLSAWATAQSGVMKVFATGVTKAYTVALKALRFVVLLVAGAFKAAWGVLAANPLVALVAAIVAGGAMLIASYRKQIKALNALRDANREVRKELEKQADAIRTIDDYNSALNQTLQAGHRGRGETPRSPLGWEQGRVSRSAQAIRHASHAAQEATERRHRPAGTGEQATGTASP
jgi:hypothetical protein